jgi:hypothetical protein
VSLKFRGRLLSGLLINVIHSGGVDGITGVVPERIGYHVYVGGRGGGGRFGMEGKSGG